MAKSAFQKPKWPSSGEMKSWAVCYLNCLAVSEPPAKAASKAESSLRHLAALGFEKQAIRLLQGFIDRLGKADSKQFLSLYLAGASMSLEVPSPRSVDKFLKMAEAREASGSKKSKSRKAVEAFRKTSGLEESDEVLPLAEFCKAQQQFFQCDKQGDRRGALKLLMKMRKLIREVDYFWVQARLTLSVVKGYRRLGDQVALDKYIRWIDKNGYANDLKNGNLASMGLRDVAIDRAQRQIKTQLKKLRNSDDPNVHFPVNKICKNLFFMIHVGERSVANKLLARTLNELPEWNGLMAGFATSGVFTELAEVLVEFGEHDLAQEFLSGAIEVGKSERNRGFRKGAIRAASNSSALIGGTADAIEKAREIRSAKSRRKQLVPLLVKIGEWKELRKVLADVDSAKEATEMALKVKYALPSGIWL